MKKYFYGTVILAVLSVFGFYACNEAGPNMNENVEKGDNYSQTNYYTRAQLQPLNRSEIQIIYNQITPQNRYDLWVDKLTMVRNLPINSTQVGLINAVLSEMSPEAFTWQTPEHIDFTDTYLPSIAASLSSSFTNQEGLNAFYNLYDLKNLDDPGTVVNGGGSSGGGSSSDDCDCNTSSYFGACQVLMNNCDKSSCVDASYGCGFGGFYRCSGVCNDVPEPTSTNGGTQEKVLKKQLFQTRE